MILPELVYRRIFKFILFIVLEVVAVVLILNNSIVQQYKLMEGVRSFSYFFWKKSNDIKNYSHLKDLNYKLIQENHLLLEQNEILKNHIIRENGIEKLSDITNIISKNLGDSAVANFEFILAKVVKNTRNTQHNYLIVDKGYKQGITEDMGVITPTGVVGIVRGVGSNYSYIYSFLNTKQTISAKIGNSEVYGSLRWDGKSTNKARLTEIPLNVEITEVDIVYTSGNSSFFPSGIPIGVAGDYNVSSGTSKDVNVTLFQDYRNLDYVIVVKSKDRNQIDSLSNIVPTQNKR